MIAKTPHQRLATAALAMLAAHCAGQPRIETPTRPAPMDEATLMSRARALLSVSSEYGAEFGASDDDVLLFTNRGGSLSIWSSTRGVVASSPLVGGGAHGVAGFSVTPDRRFVVFAADRDGDEYGQIHRVPLEGGEIARLTDRKFACDPPLVAREVPGRAYFSGRDPRAPISGIYVVDVEGEGATRQAYMDEGAGFLASVSSDGTQALFLRFHNHQENVVVLVDLETGEGRAIYPASGAATVRAAAFSSDDRTVFLTTDGGGESSLVLALDAEDGHEVARYVETEAPGSVGDGLSVSPIGGQLAVSFDAGDHSLIRLLDAEDLHRLQDPPLPLGVGPVAAFSRDGRALLLTWSTIEHSMAALRYDTKEGSLSRVVAPKGQAPAAPSVRIETLTSFDGLEFSVNVVRPEGGGPVPVVVDFHGGPAGSSALHWNPTARIAVDQGWAWVAPNIRGSGGFGRAFEAKDDGPRREDAFRDIDAVYAWLEAQPWVDRERVAISGASFGGYLVLQQLTAHPRRWRAGLDLFGISDFLSFMDTTTGLVRENYLREIGDPERDRDLLVRLSPLKDVSRIERPLFVYQGANDPRVPRAQSEAIVDALEARGVPVEYILAKDEGHGASRLETRLELLVRSALFLQRAFAD